ncbi:unnamed protein product [Cylindrotheca closterium]|uniref:Amine oxidase domain-containing protein n=1 Tax=Cylindrotheca closterium TaxID=2856 RepID=A0AAD2CIK6_9STRA|nr:unnamed protein product [Cylindrotheca closterium]
MGNGKGYAMQKVDVVIIGSGASGLQCAADLKDNTELSFVVVEARDRVGGRIYSTEIMGHRGFYRDHGASWIHGLGEDGNENPMVQLLRDRDRDTNGEVDIIFQGNAWMRPMSILHNEGAIAIFANKERIPNGSATIDEALKRHYAIQRKISEYAGKMFEDGEGMKTVHLSVEEARSIVLREENAIFPMNTAVERLCPFYTFLNENWNGISSSLLPLYSLFNDDDNQDLNDHTYSNHGDYPGPHCKVKSGMRSVLDPLVSKLEGRVLLEQQVDKIVRLNDSVRVESSSGLVVIADCCVCTLPLGCLQSTASSVFQPSLTQEKLEAVSAISAGNYKKVFLTFSTIFWPIDEPLIGLIREENEPDKKGKYLLVNNLWAKHGVPCMEAVLCGDLGEWATGKRTEELMHFVIQYLEDTMPIENVEELCTHCHVTRWEEDPYTKGSYSSVKLGTLERHVDAFSAPEWEGRLIFAGEATESEHMGSVHGALISGQRAAHLVQQFFDKK